jgi:molybdate transport system substrate-binding protein
LVAITPREGAKIHDLGDFARPGLRLVICDANVPVGRYTTQVLGKMNRGGLFGDDYQKRVMANVVSQETNVRAVLGKVSLNEVDGGFVYATDAQTAPEKIVALPIPDRLNVIAEYPIAVLAKSANEDGAAAFVALVLSAEGQSLLAKRGFQPPR